MSERGERTKRVVAVLLTHTLLTDRYPFRCTCGAEVSGYIGFHEHVGAAIIAKLEATS